MLYNIERMGFSLESPAASVLCAHIQLTLFIIYFFIVCRCHCIQYAYGKTYESVWIAKEKKKTELGAERGLP